MTALAADETAARRDRLRARLADLDAQAALVTRLVNVRYLTGFTGSNGVLLVTRDEGDTLCTDGRYRDQAAEQAPDVARVIDRDLLGIATDRFAAAGGGNLAVETHDLTIDRRAKLDTAADQRGLPRPRTSSLQRAVEGLRVHKDDAEIERVRRAGAISCRALEELLTGPSAAALAGRTERDIAHELEQRMVAHGAYGRAFETIVASGPNSALPHHRPSDRVVRHGDLIVIDFGATYAGYRADCTRTVVVGPPAAWQREIYDIVHAVQAAGVAAATAGADIAGLYASAVDAITAAGYGEYFPHGLGHGIGLEAHEDPFVRRGDTGRIEHRTLVTVEPGIYLPGRGGVRIEDTVLVGSSPVGGSPGGSSGPEPLTPLTKDLLVVN